MADDAEAAEIFSAASIKRVMSSSGPMVKCILLKATGEAEEHTIDMTPAAGSVSKLLSNGDKACTLTFLGQWKVR